MNIVIHSSRANRPRQPGNYTNLITLARNGITIYAYVHINFKLTPHGLSAARERIAYKLPVRARDRAYTREKNAIQVALYKKMGIYRLQGYLTRMSEWIATGSADLSLSCLNYVLRNYLMRCIIATAPKAHAFPPPVVHKQNSDFNAVIVKKEERRNVRG